MDIKITVSEAALAAVENLLDQDWFPNPGRTHRSYREDGSIVLHTEAREYYHIHADGLIDRIYLHTDWTHPEPIIL